MSVLTMTLKHGRSVEEARRVLENSVSELCSRFGPMIERVHWSADRNAVSLHGAGCTVEVRVDPIEMHVTADLGILGNLLGAPLVNGFKQIIAKNVQGQLNGPRS